MDDYFFKADLISISAPKQRKKNSCKGKDQKTPEIILESDVIAEIRCDEKVGLQLIKNALEEAQSDY